MYKFLFQCYTHLHSCLTVALILFKRILKNVKIYLINACIEQLVQVAIIAKIQIGRNLGTKCLKRSTDKTRTQIFRFFQLQED